MQIIFNARKMEDSYYYSQFYMATFPFLRQHNAKTAMHIYLITVSINRMLISQLTFLGPVVGGLEFSQRLPLCVS